MSWESDSEEHQPDIENGDEEALVLPKAGLEVRNGRLTLRSKEGELLASFSLHAMEDIRLVPVFSIPCFVIATLAMAAAVLCKLFIDSTFWSWTATLVLAVLAILFMLGVRTREIEITTGDGSTTIEFFDDDSVAAAFVLSVKERMTHDEA